MIGVMDEVNFFADLSDLVGAGWQVKILPVMGAPTLMSAEAMVIFERQRDDSETAEQPGEMPHVVLINRFAMRMELARVVHLFHERVFPIPPEGDLPGGAPVREL